MNPYYDDSAKRRVFGEVQRYISPSTPMPGPLPTLVPTVPKQVADQLALEVAQKMIQLDNLQEDFETIGFQLRDTQAAMRSLRLAYYDAATKYHDDMHHHKAFSFCIEPVCAGFRQVQDASEKYL